MSENQENILEEETLDEKLAESAIEKEAAEFAGTSETQEQDETMQNNFVAAVEEQYECNYAKVPNESDSEYVMDDNESVARFVPATELIGTKNYKARYEQYPNAYKTDSEFVKQSREADSNNDEPNQTFFSMYWTAFCSWCLFAIAFVLSFAMPEHFIPVGIILGVAGAAFAFAASCKDNQINKKPTWYSISALVSSGLTFGLVFFFYMMQCLYQLDAGLVILAVLAALS